MVRHHLSVMWSFNHATRECAWAFGSPSSRFGHHWLGKGFGGRHGEVLHFWPVEVRTELKRIPACTAIESSCSVWQRRWSQCRRHGSRWGGVYTAVLVYSEEEVEVVVDWVKADPWDKPLRLIMEGWKLGCRRACLMRWSLRMKRLSQSGHRKRFSPVWVRRCRANSSERANFFSQSGQVHGKGLSPRQKHEWSTTHY